RLEATRVGSAIEVRWQAYAASAAELYVERAEYRDGPWMSPELERRTDGNIVIAVDRGVECSKSYWYRLASRDVAAVIAAAPVLVTSTCVSSGLRYAGPNP